MGTLLQAAVAFFVSDRGKTVGTAVTNTAAIAAIMAAVVPVASWFTGHKDDTLICISYGEAVFWLVILLVLVKVAHYTRPPGQ